MFGKSVFLRSILFLLATSSLGLAAQYTEVITDGAMVYKRADFGSDILGYLRAGKQVMVSSKAYGAFYRVKLRQGVVGYVSDVDIRVPEPRASSNRPRKKTRFRPKVKRPDRPILAYKLMGGSLAFVPFVDRIKINSAEVSKSSNTPFVQFKYSNPSAALDGVMITDINVGMSLGVPKLYDKFSENKATGFVLLADYSWLKPVYSLTKLDYSVYWGAGLTAIYTNIKIGVKSGSEIVSVPAAELRVGALLKAGFSYRLFRDYAFKIEPTLYWEKEKYLAFSFSLQKAF